MEIVSIIAHFIIIKTKMAVEDVMQIVKTVLMEKLVIHATQI